MARLIVSLCALVLLSMLIQCTLCYPARRLQSCDSNQERQVFSLSTCSATFCHENQRKTIQFRGRRKDEGRCFAVALPSSRATPCKDNRKRGKSYPAGYVTFYNQEGGILRICMGSNRIADFFAEQE